MNSLKIKLSHYCVRRETALKGSVGEWSNGYLQSRKWCCLHANNNSNVVEIFRFHDSPWLYSTTSTSVTAQSTHAKSISNQQSSGEWECCVLSSRDTGLTSWVSKPICGDSGAVSLGWGNVKDNGKYQHKNQALLDKSLLGHTKLSPEGLPQQSVKKPSSNNFLNPNMGL